MNNLNYSSDISNSQQVFSQNHNISFSENTVTPQFFPKLSKSAKKYLTLILRYIDEGFVFNLTSKQIAQRISVNHKHVEKIARGLRESGILKIIPRYKQHALYEVSPIVSTPEFRLLIDSMVPFASHKHRESGLETRKNAGLEKLDLVDRNKNAGLEKFLLSNILKNAGLENHSTSATFSQIVKPNKMENAGLGITPPLVPPPSFPTPLSSSPLISPQVEEIYKKSHTETIVVQDTCAKENPFASFIPKNLSPVVRESGEVLKNPKTKKQESLDAFCSELLAKYPETKQIITAAHKFGGKTVSLTGILEFLIYPKEAISDAKQKVNMWDELRYGKIKNLLAFVHNCAKRWCDDHQVKLNQDRRKWAQDTAQKHFPLGESKLLNDLDGRKAVEMLKRTGLFNIH